MVHQRLILIAFGGAWLLGCAGEAPPATTPRADEALAPAHAQSSELDGKGASWGKFHSKRFQLTVPLPDGRAWKIDDHRGSELVALHQETNSQLTITATQHEELMNRQRCEDHARSHGSLPTAPLSTIEDDVIAGPSGYDSRVSTAIAAPRSATEPNATIEGHVFLFGASIRRCLFVHFSTRASAQDEAVIASRLATASSRIVRAITVDAPRTSDEVALPRPRPETRP